MAYVVIKGFRDKENDEHTYKKDDPYPVSGEPSEERIEYLMGEDNKLGKPVIKEVDEGEEPEQPNEGEDDSDKEEGPSFPKHTGGGWYELSNGEKVQGKEEAEQAEKELT